MNKANLSSKEGLEERFAKLPFSFPILIKLMKMFVNKNIFKKDFSFKF